MTNRTTTPMDIPLEHLEPSPLQYRRTINEAALAALAVDVKARGVLQRIRARPNPAGALHPYQIVYGHRRFAAAQLAGLATIPTDVCEMTDEEVRLAQIAENMDREDVHPIEEGEAFAALIADCGYTRERIAQEYGKSESYVAGRLKLLQAVPEVRKACMAGEIGSEVALLIARLRTEALQQSALETIRGELNANLADAAASSFREIKELLRRRFTLDLRDAPFDTNDTALMPDTPACSVCPKRAGNAPEFEDLLQPQREAFGVRRPGNPDTCTDPDCYAAKSAQARAVKVAELEAKGKTVMTEKQAAAITHYGSLKDTYVAVADVKAQLKQAKDKGHVVKVMTLLDPKSQKPLDVVKRADLQAAGAQSEQDKQRARDNAKRAKLQDQLDERREGNKRLLHAVHQAMLGQPITIDALRVVAEHLVGVAYDYRDDCQLIDDLYGWTDQPNAKQVIGNLGSMDAAELTRLIVTCCITDNVDPYRLEQQPEALLIVARSLGIDPAQASAKPADAAEPIAPAKNKKSSAKARKQGALELTP